MHGPKGPFTTSPPTDYNSPIVIDRAESRTRATLIVFVVDDDSSVRTALGRLFRSRGLKVETFAYAWAFLSYRRPSGPACLVLDIQMPGVSGIELKHKLSKIDPELPIVLITGLKTEQSEESFREGEVIDILYKPLDSQRLLSVVHRALGHQQV